jgi:hypothetical protein
MPDGTLTMMTAKGRMVAFFPDGAEGSLAQTAEIATARGWSRAGVLRPKDEVITYHRGLRPVASVTTHEGGEIIRVPAGPLGNSLPFEISATDLVAFEADVCDIMHDCAVVLLPAEALVGFRGITKAEARADSRVVLTFDQPELVFQRTGALLYCGNPSEAWALECGPGEDSEGIAVLSHGEAKRLLALANSVEAEAVRFTAPIC